ncbi:MAG: ATP-dependent helicase HrpB [Bdellovibrionia bacterium]
MNNDHLPIDDYLEIAREKLQTHDNLIVTAAPGAGKTTRLPAYLAKFAQGKVLVLEPRRMAAVAAAHRIAEEQNWSVGNEVGFQVRYQNKTVAQTKLIFMTEALLAKKLQDDPELSGVEYVILDEFHERSLHVDLALGLIKELQEYGSKIKLVIMSATLNAAKISQYLNGAPILEVPGKLFPCEIIHAAKAQQLQINETFFSHIIETCKLALTKTSHDILVFLPGVGEIERTAERLQKTVNCKIVVLHGSLSLELQKEVLKKSTHQRIILSTNIAESSVTLDGVNCVIDCGLAKVMKVDLQTGFSRLELSRISLASATQRAGRAARQMNGLCFKLWTKMDEASMVPHDSPEVLRQDLSEALLLLATQGIRDFNNFSWFDKPAPYQLSRTLDFLIGMGALDDSHNVTDLGKSLLRFPLPLRLGKLVLSSNQPQVILQASILTAILQERDFVLKPSLQTALGIESSDIEWRYQLIKLYSQSHKHYGLSRAGVETVMQSAQQIASLLKVQFTVPDDWNKEIERLLALAYQDRICKLRDKKSKRALMIGGRGVQLHPESVAQIDDFFIALSGIESGSSSETLISWAHPLSKKQIFEIFGEQIREESVVEFDEKNLNFLSKTKKLLGQITIEEGQVQKASPEEISSQLPQILSEKFTWVLKENSSLAKNFEKLHFLKFHQNLLPEELRDQLLDLFTDNEISSTFLHKMFMSASYGQNNIHTIVSSDLTFHFENSLPESLLLWLRKLPNYLVVPSGSKIEVHYPADKNPYLEVRIQEVFGWQASPKILDSLTVTMHLLGPNYRPVQVTSDLNSFWNNAYSEVRKELRLKYPKHQWPENPADGVAEAKGRRR